MKVHQNVPIWLQTKVLSIVNKEIFGKSQYFSFIKTNITSAKKLKSHLEKVLESFEYDNSGREKLKTILNQKLSKHFDDSKADEVVNKKRVTELQNNIDKLEERFILNEITKEQYDKFSSKYRAELSQLKKETKTYAEMSSNLEKAVEKGLNIAENIS